MKCPFKIKITFTFNLHYKIRSQSQHTGHKLNEINEKTNFYCHLEVGEIKRSDIMQSRNESSVTTRKVNTLQND